MFRRLASRVRAINIWLLAPLCTLLGFFAVLTTTTAPVAQALTSSTNLNFQARLLTNTGAIVPDGTYNIDFKIYNADNTTGTVGTCTGACLWEETRLVASSQGVSLVNGYFSVNLGSVNAFPSTINWDQQLYLTMNVTTNGTTSCTPATSCTWNGEMQNSGHSIALTAVPLAFMANKLQVNNGTQTGTLSFGAVTNSPVITLPNETGTVCTSAATSPANCTNFAPATGGSGYVQLQGSTPGTAQTGNFNISGGGAGTGIATTFQAANFDVATSNTAMNIGTTGAAGITIGNITNSTVTFKGKSSTTAFQIQNSSGSSLLNIDSSNGNTSNLVANSSFESALANWNALNGGAASQSTTSPYEGADVLKIVDGTGAGGGGATYTGASPPLLVNGTTYTLSAYVRTDFVGAFTTFEMGHADNGTAPTLVPCLTGQTLTTGWTRFSCSWTSGAITGNPFIYFKQTDTTVSRNIYVDDILLQTDANSQPVYRNGAANVAGTIIASPLVLQASYNASSALQVNNSVGTQVFNVDTTDTNLVLNPGFEVNQSNWAVKGSASALTRDSSTSYAGIASGKVTTTATAGDGLRYTFPTQLPASTYTISAYVKVSAADSTFNLGYNNGADVNCATITPAASATVPSTSGWTRFVCTTATSAVLNSIYITSGSTALTSLWVDSVQVEAGSIATAYGAGNINLNAVLQSPLFIRNLNNSTTALSLQDSSSNLLFNVDTLNDTLSLGSSGAQVLKSTVNIANTTDATNAQVVNLGSNANNTSDITTIQGGSNTTAAIALTPNNAGGITIGAAAGTGQITVGSSTAGQTVVIGNGSGAPTVNIANTSTGGATVSIAGANGNTSLNSVSIANGNTGSGGATVSILSGVGTAGTGTLNLGNNTRVTSISLGNVNPAAARTIAIGNTTVTANAAVDTINIATNPTTVAGGNTLHIADGTPTGSGTNLVTIGSASNTASTLTLQGGTGASAILLQTGNNGTTTAGNIQIGNTTGAFAQTINIGNNATASSTSTVVIGSTTNAANTTTIEGGNTSGAINIGTATTAHTINIGTGGTNTQAVNIGSINGSSAVQILGGTGGSAVSIQAGTNGTIAVGSANGNTVNIGGNVANTPVNITSGGTGNITLTSNSSSTGTTIKSGTNSATAFQVQNAAGSPLFLVDTTSTDAAGATVNYLTYPGFEVGNPPTGWAAVNPTGGTTTLTQNTNKQHTYNGSYSASVAIGANTSGGGGLHTTNFNSAPPGSATYIVSFYVKISSGTIASNAFTVTSTGGAGSCSPAAGITINANGFQRLYCSLAAGAGSITDFKISDNVTTAHTLYIDSVQMQPNIYNGVAITTPTAYQFGAIQIRGAITNPLVVANNGDSTSSIQVQATSGNTVWAVDTLNAQEVLGTSNKLTGKLLFNSSANTGSVALTIASPGTNNFTLTVPTLSGNANICTTDAVCGVGGTTNNYLVQVPTSTSANTAGANVISPTAAGINGLIVNSTNNATTGATAAIINQTLNVATANIEALTVNGSNAANTIANGISYNQTGAGTTTNGILINRTAGTLANGLVFQGTIGTDITAAAGRALTITGNAASTWQSSGGLTVSATSGNLSLSATAASSQVTLDSGSSGTVNLGNSNATTIAVGGASGSTTTIGGGNVAHTISIGSAATNTSQGITIGSPTSVASNLLLQGGTGVSAIILQTGATGGAAGAVTIGNTSGANTQNINIGTNATGSSSTTVTIGSTVAGTVNLQPAGGVNLGVNNSLAGKIIFNTTGGTGTATITLASNPTTSYTYQLPTGTVSSNQCLQSGAVSGGNVPLTFAACGTGLTLANVYNNGATAADQTITLATAKGGGVVIQDASSPIAANLFTVQANGTNSTPYLNITASNVAINNNNDNTGYLNTPSGGFGQYSNLLLQSEAFDQTSAWTYTSVTTPTANTVAAPDGNTTAESLADSASGGKAAQSFTTATTGNYTFSVWLKAAANQNVDLRIDATGTNAQTGTVKTVVATTAWQRFFVTQNITGPTISTIVVNIFPGQVGGSGTVSAWGAQLVTGTNPEVYVGTGTSNFSSVTTGLTASGNSLFIPVTDSATAFQVQNSSGLSELTINSTSNIVQVGSGTTDSNEVLLQLDSYNTFTDSGTCTTTSLQGSLYYNTNTNAIRACINGGWEDLLSTAGLGIMMYGVVPDSGSNPGDLASDVTAGTSGPCKVSWSGTFTVSVAPCVAYSGGRKVIVATATTVNLDHSVSGEWEHLCFTSSGTLPTTLSAATSTETNTTNNPTFSVNNPIVCLADIQMNGTTGVNAIFDIRTFTNTQKDFAETSSALALGAMACYNTTASKQLTTCAANGNGEPIAGVVVATDLSTSSTTPNAIIAVAGPTTIKCVLTSNVAGDIVQISSGTANRCVAVTPVPVCSAATSAGCSGWNWTPWSNMGIARKASPSTACATTASAANCDYGMYFNQVRIN